MITTRVVNNQTIIYEDSKEIARWEGKKAAEIQEFRDSVLNDIFSM